MFYRLIIIVLLAFIVIFIHSLVVIDFKKKSKSVQGKVKTIWIWLSFIPVLGPVIYLSSGNYNNSGKKIFFLILLSAFLIELMTSPLRGYKISFLPGEGGMGLCAVVTFILYFIFINLMLKGYTSKIKPQWVLIACFLGCLILQLPVRIMSFSSSLGSLLDFLFHLLGIVMGYLFYKSNKIICVNILAFSFLCCLLLYFKGYDMWLDKLNFGTFTGKIESKQNYDLNFQTNSGDTLSLSDFKDKYLLLDCWNSYCGVCYKKMPKMQQLYDEFKSDPKVSIYSMHSCFIKKYSENYTTGSDILEKRGFSFPCMSIDIDNPVLKELGVNAYPTVLIFDKESNLIFRGSIENARYYMKMLTYSH